jgi:arsenite-transporting ATPase
MCKHRENVLIISTDPAHNLSDAFDQKFSGEPSQIKGFENLFAMEIDPSSNTEGGAGGTLFNMSSASGGAMEGMTEEMAQQSKGFMQEILGSIPGIDEATAFGQVLKSLDSYKFDLIIFDTAPTGHTLRLLNFPNILEKGIVKLIELKEKFGGMLGSMGGMMGGQANPEELHKKLFESMDTMKKKVEDINSQFKDPEKTTFVAVCIPEFLSMYETERLCIELAKQEIDIRNIIVN